MTRRALLLATALLVAPRAAFAQPLPPALQQLAQRARGGAFVCLLLDWDGTLREFERTPVAARPTPAIRALLGALARSPRIEVNLVSGRPRQDLERWFGALPIGLHAEHGLWSRTPGEPWQARLELGRLKPELARVRPFAAAAAARLPGALLEDKSAGFAFHYRRAERAAGRLAAQRLATALRTRLQGSALEVLEGERVCEVRPRQAHKGAVAAAIAARLARAPRGRRAVLVAIGDDRTDEDMFRAVAQAPGAVTIKVGAGPTAARLRLASPAAVRAFLGELVR